MKLQGKLAVADDHFAEMELFEPAPVQAGAVAVGESGIRAVAVVQTGLSVEAAVRHRIEEHISFPEIGSLEGARIGEHCQLRRLFDAMQRVVVAVIGGGAYIEVADLVFVGVAEGSDVAAVDAVTAAEPVAGRIFKVDRAVDGLARRVAVRDENLVPQQRIAVPAGFDCEETVVVL